MVKRLFCVIFLLFGLGASADERVLSLSFSSENASSPALLLKAVNLGLDEINARVAFVQEFSASPFFYSLSVEYGEGFDLNQIRKSFIKNGIAILNFNKSSQGVDLVLDASGLKIASEDGEDELFLPRQSFAYFLSLNGAKKLSIRPEKGSEWIAKVLIFDGNLKHISTTQRQSPTSVLQLDLDQNASYALIDDAVDINNIKGGLKINLTKE